MLGNLHYYQAFFYVLHSVFNNLIFKINLENKFIWFKLQLNSLKIHLPIQ